MLRLRLRLGRGPHRIAAELIMPLHLAPVTATDMAGAFVPGETFEIGSGVAGPLAGLRFAVKDLIDIEEHRTGGGNLDWLEAASPAKVHAPVVEHLLAAGAICVGKTITDELAFSLEGRNAHYGTPRNPRNPAWLPGGSSSGSAVAVASGMTDFALGTDSGGSVRVPAAFCGVYGFRPSHGALSLDGVIPFSPSYDTVGWFARDAEVLRRVGNVLLPPATGKVGGVSIAEDAVSLLEPPFARAFMDAARRVASSPPIRLLEKWPLEQLQWAYSTIQGYEIARSLGARIDALGLRFGADIAARFASTRTITYADYATASVVREQFSAWLDTQLRPDRVALLPAASVPYLEISAGNAEIGHFYAITLGLTAIAGHAGMPQLQVGAGPLSMLTSRGADRALLDLAVELSSGVRFDGR